MEPGDLSGTTDIPRTQNWASWSRYSTHSTTCRPVIVISTNNRHHTREINWTLTHFVFTSYTGTCLQCFDAVGWAAGRASACKKQSGGVLAWLSVWSEVQTCIWTSWCHCHSLSLAPVKSRLVLPFWYRLTQVVLEKRPLNGCVVVVLDLYADNDKPITKTAKWPEWPPSHKKIECWGAGVVSCHKESSNYLHMVQWCQCHCSIFSNFMKIENCPLFWR